MSTERWSSDPLGSLELWPEEEIVWSGRGTGPRVGRTSVLRTLTGTVIVVLGAAIWGVIDPETSSGLRERLRWLLETGSGAAALVGIVVVAAAAAVGWRLFRGKLEARGAAYAVTNRRVVIARPGAELEWVGARELLDVRLSEHPDGSGDLVFERRPSGLEGALTEPMLGEEDAPMFGEKAAQDRFELRFLGIPDAAAVYALVRERFDWPDEPPPGLRG